ncbi:MAG: hypothetical protein ACTH3G_11865, partial [Citricoccus sp.]
GDLTATAIHWACIDVSDVDQPVLQKWHALDSVFQVAGASEQVHSALDRSSNASRSMAGTGYRLEKILYGYAQAARAHAENRLALGDEAGEYHEAVNLHGNDPAWEKRLDDWFERLQLWKRQVNEEYAENDENCHRALRGYLDGALTTMEYGFPRGPRPEGEDRVTEPGDPTPDEDERILDTPLEGGPLLFGGDDPYSPPLPDLDDIPRAEVPKVEVPTLPAFPDPDEPLRPDEPLETLPAYPDGPGLGGSGGEGESGGGGKVQPGIPEPDDDGSAGRGKAPLDSPEEEEDAPGISGVSGGSGGSEGAGGSGKLTLGPIEPADEPVRDSGKLRLDPVEDEGYAVADTGKAPLGGAPVEVPEKAELGGAPVEEPEKAELGGAPVEVPEKAELGGAPIELDTEPGLALGSAGAAVAAAAAVGAAKSR